MDRWDNPKDEKYFGLADWQFDLAIFLLIGVVALGAYLLGGAHALGIRGNDEAVAPVASSVVQAPISEDGEASNAPSGPDADEDPDAILRAEALFLGVFAVLVALVAPFLGILAVPIALEAPFLGVSAVLVALVTVVAVLAFIGGDGTDNSVS